MISESVVFRVVKIKELNGSPEKPRLRGGGYVYKIEYDMLKSTEPNIGCIYLNYYSKPEKLRMNEGDTIFSYLEAHGPSSFKDWFKIFNRSFDYKILYSKYEILNGSSKDELHSHFKKNQGIARRLTIWGWIVLFSISAALIYGLWRLLKPKV
jgi:hypothetical protein